MVVIKPVPEEVDLHAYFKDKGTIASRHVVNTLMNDAGEQIHITRSEATGNIKQVLQKTYGIAFHQLVYDEDDLSKVDFIFSFLIQHLECVWHEYLSSL